MLAGKGLSAKFLRLPGHRPRTVKTRVALVALFVLFPSALLERPVFGAGEESAAPAAATPPQAEEQAKALYRQAREKYEIGDLAGALSLMEKAYAIYPQPAFLFNLGQLNRELDRCRPALEKYRSYLELEPTGPRRADAQEIVSKLSAECPDAPPPAPPASPPSHPSTMSYWTPPHVVAWSALGAGVAATAGSIYFGLRAQSAARDVESLASSLATQPPGARTTWDAAGQERQRDGQRSQDMALVLGLGAVALVAGGLVTLAMTPARSETAPAVSWSIQPGAVRGFYSVRF